MLIASRFICGVLYFLLYSYIFCTLVCNDKFKINYLIVLGALLNGFINILLMTVDIGYLKPYLVHFCSLVFVKFIYKQKFIKTLLGMIFFLGLATVSELLFGIVSILIFKFDPSSLNNNLIIYIFVNSAIFIIILLISRISFVRKLMKYVLNWYNYNETKSLSIFAFLFLTISIFLLYNNFSRILPTSLLWLTNIFCVAVFIFVFGFFKEKLTNNKIIYQYDQLMDYVKVYERLLEEKSKNQHEYKNQLVIIRDIDKKKDRLEYINNLLDVKETTNDNEWLSKLRYFPQGGLKGLLYYKIQQMLKNNISVLVNASEELKKNKQWRNFNKNLLDISKVIGVYLDNAIEAVNNINDKNILISVYLENNEIVFEISNNYKGYIDTLEIDKEGYTTKGNGKGYGLSLVKDIINKNDNLSQKRIINGNYYTQKLFIKK